MGFRIQGGYRFLSTCDNVPTRLMKLVPILDRRELVCKLLWFRPSKHSPLHRRYILKNRLLLSHL